MMLSYLMLSTAYGAWPTFEVQCRENNRAMMWDKTLKKAQQWFKDNKDSNMITNLIPVSTFTKLFSQVVGGANPLLFDRVECLNKNKYEPCTDMFGETLCEQVALYKQQKTSTCKPMHNLSLTAAAAPQAQDSLTCNMEDAKSLESMELYIARGKVKFLNFYPKCPEGLQLEDKSMEDAVYDKDQKTFTLTTGPFWNETSEDVTDQVVCRASTREESVNDAKDTLSSSLTTILRGLQGLRLLKKNPKLDTVIASIKLIQGQLDKLSADDIIRFVDNAMVNLDAEMTKLAKKMNKLTGGHINKHHMIMAKKIAQKYVNNILS